MVRVNRFRYDWSEAIGRAIELMPMVVECDWFTGADPVFAGLNTFGADVADGRSYRDTAHMLAPYWSIDRRTSIVLPGRARDNKDAVRVVVHEMGHVVDEMLGRTRDTVPISSYAHVNRGESFAEAFAGWLVPDPEDLPVVPDDWMWFANLAFWFV